MDNAPLILLLLVGIVLLFGVGVVIVNRRRTQQPTPVATPPTPRIEAPPEPPVEEHAVEDVTVEEVTVEEVTVEPDVVAPPKKRFAKAAGIFTGAFAGVRAKDKITADTWDDLEETLLRADVGLGVTTSLLENLKTKVDKKEVTEPRGLIDALRADMTAQLSANARELTFDTGVKQPNIWLFVGVNGVGKTTTIGKLAAWFQSQGKKVILGAGDTFRAAAIDQLQTWADRTGVELIKQQPGADPAAVAFDTVKAGKARGADVIIIDTAGRLHSKEDLMAELAKINRSIAKELPGAPHETLLVIDSTTGQNAVQQVRAFSEVVKLTGLVATKLDGTAKGGVLVGIAHQFRLPISFIGVGEKVNDLRPFKPSEFVSAMV